MPSEEIYLDLDQLIDDAKAQTDSAVNEIDTAMIQACNIVATLTTCGWSGEAKDAFLEKFTEYKKGMRVFSGNLASLSAALAEIHGSGTDVLEQGKSLSGSL